MGDPLNPDDFLTRALRESRVAVADEGFSRRVAERVLVERRRMRWARALPALMAMLGLALACGLTGFTAFHVGTELPRALGALEQATRGLTPVLGVLAHYGVPPWMVVAAVGALVFALLSSRQDARGAFRF